MKEVTRVHIAKTTYEMEIEAKKTLGAYLDTIKRYTGDDELINDVETRIVELLGERGIKKGRVVTHDDVEAVTNQLGAPEEFSDDGDITTGPTETLSPNKKLYRDSGHAVIGGVIAGIARYYGVRTVWIRLLFVLSLILTSGVSALPYVLLWLVVPATKSAGDVLRLEGKPVSVTRSTGDDLAVNPARDRRILRVLSVIAGVVLLIGAFVAMVAAVIGLFAVAFHGGLGAVSDDLVMIGATPWIIWSSLAVAVTGFALMLLVAYLLISWRVTKAIVIVISIIFGLTLLSGMSAIASTYIGRQQLNEQRDRMTETRTIMQPSLSAIKSLSIVSNTASTDISYVITPNATPKVVLTVFKGTKDPTVTVDGDTARITILANAVQPPFEYFPARVTIYGPSLESIDAQGGSLAVSGNTYRDITNPAIENLRVSVGRYSSLALSGLKITTLTASLDEKGSIDTTGASVSNVNLTAKGIADANFATLGTLSITAPESCASRLIGLSTYAAEDVTAGSFTLNDKSYANGSRTPSCIAVQIESAGNEPTDY